MENLILTISRISQADYLRNDFSGAVRKCTALIFDIKNYIVGGLLDSIFCNMENEGKANILPFYLFIFFYKKS